MNDYFNGPCLPTCPDRTPLVSPDLGALIYSRLRITQIESVKMACADWLCQKNDGLAFYLGIRGRGYNSQEKAAIATDQHVVANIRCPFHLSDGGSLIGGCCSTIEYALDGNNKTFLWLPTYLMKRFDEPALIYLIDTRQVADAKIALATVREDFPIVVPGLPYLVGEETHQADVLRNSPDQTEVVLPNGRIV